MLIDWAILSKVEFPVVGWRGGGVVVFWPNILSILVLIEIRIRIKTRLWQYIYSRKIWLWYVCLFQFNFWTISHLIYFWKKEWQAWAELSKAQPNTGAMVYWPSDDLIVIRIKFKNGFEVYSLSSVTLFPIGSWIQAPSYLSGGWVAVLMEIITISV